MNKIEKITVYLGSSGRCRLIFKETAQNFGKIIGKKDKTLVYGGMDTGLMGIVANNALDSGAKVTGIIPRKLKDSERIHPNLSQTILVPDLWERKLKMFNRADAIITLPGGFGTIDEALEALYWADLGSHAKPVVFVNTDGYWDSFLRYIETLPDLQKDYLLIADTVDDIFPILEKWTPPKTNGDQNNLPNFEGKILQDTNAPIIIDTASVKDSYFLATALGLKQLSKHHRPMGLLNNNGQFDDLIHWVKSAQKEKFITDHCTDLFAIACTMDELTKKIKEQEDITIDLAHEKWGPSETSTHLEIKETE
ncbi:MAG: TIGR00730 family Rossman fold protein [Alphaproteobacteria bacterium]